MKPKPVMRIFCMKGNRTGGAKLFGDGLGDAEVREEIAELARIESLEQSLGHEAAANRPELLHLGLAQRDVLAFEPTQHEHLGILLDEETAQAATVLDRKST